MRVEKHLFSRLIYANPVCLLSVISRSRANVMTITWLTPCDNKGLFVMSLNKNRFSAKLLKESRAFVLSIPVAGMEELVLTIGGKTGSECDKFSKLNIPVCAPGWQPVSQEVQEILDSSSAQFLPQQAAPNGADTAETVTTNEKRRVRFAEEHDIIPASDKPESKQAPQTSPQYVAISSCVAHLVCSVLPSVSSDFANEEQDGHYILLCRIDDAFVNADYWESGKTLVPSPGNPPLLSFLGSQQFAYMTKPDFWTVPES